MVIGETCYTLSRTKYCSDLLLRSFLLRIVSFLPRLTLYRLKCKQSETIGSFVEKRRLIESIFRGMLLRSYEN